MQNWYQMVAIYDPVTELNLLVCHGFLKKKMHFNILLQCLTKFTVKIISYESDIPELLEDKIHQLYGVEYKLKLCFHSDVSQHLK